jgi:hypothetical protein
LDTGTEADCLTGGAAGALLTGGVFLTGALLFSGILLAAGALRLPEPAAAAALLTDALLFFRRLAPRGAVYLPELLNNFILLSSNTQRERAVTETVTARNGLDYCWDK